MCLHYSTIHKSTPQATSAPYQDLIFFKDLIRYQSIDKSISGVMIKNNMWPFVVYITRGNCGIIFRSIRTSKYKKKNDCSS